MRGIAALDIIKRDAASGTSGQAQFVPKKRALQRVKLPSWNHLAAITVRKLSQESVSPLALLGS